MSGVDFPGRKSDEGADGCLARAFYGGAGAIMLVAGTLMVVLFGVMPFGQFVAMSSEVETARNPLGVALLMGALTPFACHVARIGWLVGGRAFGRERDLLIPWRFAAFVNAFVAVPTTLFLVVTAVRGAEAGGVFYETHPYRTVGVVVVLYGALVAVPYWLWRRQRDEQ